MKVTILPTRRERGSAMLMVLWGMMIMAMAVGGLVLYMRRSVLDDVDAAKAFEARLLAESGIALALHPGVKPNDPLLHQQISPVKRYDVHVTTEGGRIAINQISARREIRDLCIRLFIIWGLDPEKAGVLADSLKDWVDGDDRVSSMGAEDAHYTLRGAPTFPRNRPFSHLDEMLFVRGMVDLARRKPDWRRFFTLHGDGRIDVNEASSELLEVACEVTRAQADAVVLLRRGPDIRPKTEDDTPFEDLADVQEALGLSDWDFEDIESRLTLKHPVRRVESKGRAGDFEVILTAIVGPGVNLIEERHVSAPGRFELEEVGRDGGSSGRLNVNES